jgi:hypothetical protein
MSNLVRTQILLEKSQRLALQEIAKKEGKSFSEIVRTLIDAQLRQRKYNKMRLAAEQLANDYGPGGELSNLITFGEVDTHNE